MKPFVRNTLMRQRVRLHELDALLSASDVVDNMDRFRALSREHADASLIVAVFNRLLCLRANGFQRGLHTPGTLGARVTYAQRLRAECAICMLLDMPDAFDIGIVQYWLAHFQAHVFAG